MEIGLRPSGSPGARETARLIADRLLDARVDDVRRQRPYANVVGRLRGSGDGTVVVGAHYDTKDAIPGFLGANDGASGVAVLLELARSLPRPLPGPSVDLALFDAEEARGDRPFQLDGTRGSPPVRRTRPRWRPGGFAAAEPDPRHGPLRPRRRLRPADSAEAGSDPDLYELFARGAERRTGSPAPFEGTTGPIADDHVPFLVAGVPAVDLIDFDYGRGSPPGAHWHTAQDTLDKVCPESLDAVGEAALRAIPRIRRAGRGMGAWRRESTVLAAPGGWAPGRNGQGARTRWRCRVSKCSSPARVSSEGSRSSMTPAS